MPRATVVNMKDSWVMLKGDPILDTDEGVLIIAFEDGTSRVFNWSHVVDYYAMTDDEYEELMRLSEQFGESL